MYKIILDSCGELTTEMKDDGHFCNVPLTIEIDGHSIVDDESFDQQDFLRRVRESPTGPKSACPSPESYMKAYEGDADNVYVVTLSSKLSGSYNSAVLAERLYREEHKEKKNIHVFDSCSASIGETLIGIMAQELERAGATFEEVVRRTEAYIRSQHTFFVLETLETLRKAGRLSNLKAFVAQKLSIKPIMGSTDEGSIQQLDQSLGMKKALVKMVDKMIQVTKNCEEKIVAVSHCNCPERALYVKGLLEGVAAFRRIIVVDTAGISSMYANDGGIIMVV